MNSYFSLAFNLILLPCTIIVYCLAPRKARFAVLLAASYVFFWCLSGALIAFILISTAIVYACGRQMASLLCRRDELLAEASSGKKQIKKDCKRRMRYVLIVGAVLNFGMLFTLKYLGFFSASASSLLALLGFEIPEITATIGVPIGISFYTLMAVSYLVDVYRETVEADSNIGHVALFLAFFPQIMEGPICRYGQTAKALYAGDPVKLGNMYRGILRILYGMAKKIVVADRLNAFVDNVFTDYTSFDGGIIALAAVLYTIELYCDFSGTMDIAVGIARIFNVNLPENFRQPFFSRTSSEFWMRWHITLGTWFKDYVYYPISLSKPCKALTSKARKRFGNRYGPLLVSSIALFVVWFFNGLWHGAGSQYLLFGMYYFVMIFLGGLIEPLASAIAEELHINRDGMPYRVFQNLRTLIVIFAGEMIFRATSAADGLTMLGTAISGFTIESFSQGTVFMIGVDPYDFAIVVLVLLAMFVIGVIKERGGDPCESIAQQNDVVKWGVLVFIALFIIVFGAYGPNYTPVEPMYAQF
ncbi:MAG: MBOAT family protein [Eggerthellaceae bacterium]|nr:MBOAT family protein [Eggerthellaceae bacterium]